MWEYNYTDELYHFGILGMRWGIRRSPEELAAARKAKGAKKLAKIDKKKEEINDEIQSENGRISRATLKKQDDNADMLLATAEKNKVDRKIAEDDFWTNRGRRKAEAKSEDLEYEIERLNEEITRDDAIIADAVRNIAHLNNRISELDEKAIKIGKKYLED